MAPLRRIRAKLPRRRRGQFRWPQGKAGGASYPSAGMFGAIGGLTCFLMEGLDRPSLLDCMRKRRHYGTTGGRAGRMAIELVGRFTEPGQVYHDEPALADDADQVVASTALMGDIVRLPSGEMDLEVSLVTSSPIERVDIFNGLKLVETINPFEESDLGNRIRILWESAAYRGRSREVTWDGRAEVIGNDVREMVPVNFLNPKMTLERTGNIAEWHSMTTGNFSGFDVLLSDSESGKLRFETPLSASTSQLRALAAKTLLSTCRASCRDSSRFFDSRTSIRMNRSGSGAELP